MQMTLISINLFLKVFPRMSLHCKLVPVHYREHEIGILATKGEKIVVTTGKTMKNLPT